LEIVKHKNVNIFISRRKIYQTFWPHLPPNWLCQHWQSPQQDNCYQIIIIIRYVKQRKKYARQPATAQHLIAPVWLYKAFEKERAKERQGYSSRGNISTAGKRQRKIFHSL